MPDPLLTGKPGRIDRVTVPPMTYLAIDGQGTPGGAAYFAALGALYSLAYGARFAGKARGIEEKVGPLEGLWWAEDMGDFLTRAQDSWCWRLMIRAPGWLDAAALDLLRDKARKKAPDNTALDRVSLWRFDEGLCLQALHLGPYVDEGPLIARLHAEATAQGLALTGRHHEIYLSDPTRTAPARLKTILRQPVQTAS